MCRRPWFAAALLALVPSFAPGQSADPAKLSAITGLMQKFVDDGDLSGAVTLVGRKDGVVHHEAVGFRDLAARDAMKKDTVFRIASMTKPVTAIGIMILVDEGKVNVEDDVAKYLPEFTGQMLVDEKGKDATKLKKPARPVKVRDLLTHTAGLANYPPGVSDVYTKRNRTLAETTLATALQPLQFEPGSKWQYSNPGIDALGRIIELRGGQSYEAFLKARVFDPLGLTDTTPYPTPEQLKRAAVNYSKPKGGALTPAPNNLLAYDPKTAKHPIPAGGLYSTAADLAKVYRMMLNKGELNGKRVISEKSVAAMTSLQTGEIKTGFVDGMGWGFGWQYVREPKGVTEMMSAGTYGHGGAFGTQGWIDPKRDVFVVLLIQRNDLQNGDASPMRKALQEATMEAIRK